VQSTYKTKFQVLNAKKEATLHMLTWKSPGSMLGLLLPNLRVEKETLALTTLPI